MIGQGDPPSPFIARQIQALQHLSVEVIILPRIAKHRFLSALLLNLGITFHLPAEIKSAVKNADLIHYQWPSHWILLNQLASQYHKPSILSLRGRQINILPYIRGQEKYTRKLRKLLPQCDAYHCVSQAILNEAKNFGLKEGKAFIIRPAVDPAFFTPQGTIQSSPPLKIVMVGALMWRKGYDHALLGFKQALMNNLDLELNIIGDGPDVNRISYMIQELDLKNKVHLLGKKTPEEVRDIYQLSHVLLHTSLSEGIANVILEAMSCGLAVISTSAGGINEVIHDRENGLLIPSRDSGAVAEKIKLLYENPALRLELGKSARLSVITEHTLSRQAEKFVDMYKKVLGQN